MILVRNRKMRRAFVIGSNGPSQHSPLRYAISDAYAVKKILSNPKCGFEVTSPKIGANTWEIRLQLQKVVEACSSDDTFICYFSGHGVLDKGSLYLLWDNTEIDRLLTTAIPVSDIIQAVKYCKSSSKLLVLDCCHAGAVVNMLGLKNAADISVEEMVIEPDNHLVLMASGRLERARELQEIQGSFLTASFCSALEEKFDQADKDKDNRISITDLKKWLEEQALRHNNKNPDKPVPIPYLFGQQKGEFFFTIGHSDWIPYEIPWIDSSTMVILPVQIGNMALCISKYTVTNAQYKVFVEETKYKEPQGEHFIDGQWKGPFYPWKNKDFQADDQPVVCVSVNDAVAYCNWVNRKIDELKQFKPGSRIEDKKFQKWKEHPSSGVNVTLPLPLEWDFAAFGEIFPNHDPRTWLEQMDNVYHNASKPASIDKTGRRTNSRGLSDMVGNIWEWCSPNHFFQTAKLGIDPEHKPDSRLIELRGGGYLDDLSRVKPFLDASRLKHGENTKHSDLGFRIITKVNRSELPKNIQEKLALCKKMPLSAYSRFGRIRP